MSKVSIPHFFPELQCNGHFAGCDLVEHCERHDPQHDDQPFLPFPHGPDGVDCRGYIGVPDIVKCSNIHYE